MDVALGVVTMASGTRKGSAYDVHGGTRTRDKGLPEGKYWISACNMFGGASGPVMAYCGNLLAAGTMPGSGVKMTLFVMRAARDRSLPKGPS